MEPSGCFCSNVAPRPPLLASQSKRSGRALLITASQSGETKDRWGCEFLKESENDVFYCDLSRVVIGRVRRVMLSRDLM